MYPLINSESIIYIIKVGILTIVYKYYLKVNLLNTLTLGIEKIYNVKYYIIIFVGIGLLHIPAHRTENSYNIVMTLILAPILEEIAFRGIVLNGYIKKYGTQKALLYSVVIFSLLHGSEIGIILDAAILGTILGVIYIKNKNIYLCIILHFINNASLVFFSYKNIYYENIYIIKVLSILTIFTSLIILVKKYKQEEWCK